MTQMNFDLKMANVRTLLPMSTFGLACLWASLLCALFSPAGSISTSSVETASPSAMLPLALFAGATGLFLAAYRKRTLLVNESNHAICLVAAALLSLVGVFQLLSHSGVAIPELAMVVAWALSGCGYALLYLNWPRVFIISWKRDVGVFLGAAALGGAVINLFISNLVFPYSDIAILLLPAASTLTLFYVESHAVKGMPIEEGEEELTKLNPLIGFSLALFGVVFGFSLFWIIEYAATVDMAIISIALSLGALLLLIVHLRSRHYVAFSRIEKATLAACLIGSAFFAFCGRQATLPCCLLLLAAWVFFEFASYSSLIGFASSHHNPFWQIARGEVVLVGGIDLALFFCFFSSQYYPFLLDYSGWICTIITLAATLLAAFFPLPEYIYSDKNTYGALSGENALELRCERVAQRYKLSAREAQVLLLLARGRNAQHIGEKLVISVNTARTHIYHIYQKMGVSTQQELITLVESEDIEVL